MARLYLIRHGQSVWNQENRFTGWVDVEMTLQGRREMAEAADKIRGLSLGAAFASALRRTRESAELMFRAADMDIPIEAPWELNERFYGRLQGLNKEEAAATFGAEQVRIWRRSFDVRPPGGESLEDAGSRVLPYFERVVMSRIAAGIDCLVCGHGNTLRVITMRLQALSAKQVERLEIATGELHRYEIGTHGRIGRMEAL